MSQVNLNYFLTTIRGCKCVKFCWYIIVILTFLQGSIGTDFDGTVTGNGFFMSCGPQILKKGSKYLIYGNLQF